MATRLQQGIGLSSAIFMLVVPVSWAEGREVKQANRPATTVKEWIAQIEAATVQVIGVSLNRTETGLDIVLETAEGKPLQVDATKFRQEGNSLIADIPNGLCCMNQGKSVPSTMSW